MMLFKSPQRPAPLTLKLGLVIGLAFMTLNCGNREGKHSSQYPADNSGKNARDTEQGPPTSENQKESESDLSITQKIRQSIMAENSLSMNAKNVKIITANGIVTLRGPVDSVAEKALIAQKAKQIEGVSRIEDQIEIVTQ